jgi:hypothetical protein
MTKNNIISFLLKHPNFYIGSISTNYPFSIKQLKRYKHVLDWSKISRNEKINWSYEILIEFKELIQWSSFTINRSAFVDLSILDTFENKIDWHGNDNYWGDSIVANKGIHWDIETIDKYADKINFEKLSTASSVVWSESLLDKYIDKWDLAELANNKSIPWTLGSFEKYLDESYLFYYAVQTNKCLINYEFVMKYNHLMDWHYISLNPNLPWIEKDLLNCWSENIVWAGIACNIFLFANDKNFFHKHYDKWQSNKNLYWGYFSGNIAFPFSKNMIEKYKHYWDWDTLCSNEGIVWNSDLIDYFSKYVKWGGWKPCELLDEKGNVISPVGGAEFEFGLIYNVSIPWSIDFLLKYENKLEFEALESNTSVWEKAFKPYVDDEMVEIIMRII